MTWYRSVSAMSRNIASASDVFPNSTASYEGDDRMAVISHHRARLFFQVVAVHIPVG